VKFKRGHVTSEQWMRSGHDIVYKIGKRMSGQPSWASTDESCCHV
jgi:hypothetical protein